MNGLFGLELPTPVNFVIAFVVVLALIGAATWLVRRFGATRLEAAGRNRLPRLAVIDSAAVDGRRKLVIIRRDNVEHLLMIGGPTDVVVETNIVRAAAAAARDAAAVRVNGGETLPRAMPLPDATHWPLQPEPAVPAAAAAATPAPSVRPERIRTDDAAQWPAQVEPVVVPPAPAPAAAATPPARIQRSADALAGLASDLSRPPAAEPAAPAPRPAPPAAPRPVAAPRPAPAVQVDPQTAAVADQNLANMAQQLEAALRRPAAAPEVVHPVEPKLVEAKPADPGKVAELRPAEIKPPEPRRVEPTLRPAPRPAPPAGAAAAAPAVTPQKQPMSSLEQEMASLLGRPGRS